MSAIDIETFEFSEYGGEEIRRLNRGSNWPVVYLLHNKDELYVGETNNAAKRIKDHLKNPARDKLTKVRLLIDEEFNKSAILDIEQTLIRLYSADGMFELQNLNEGQSANHNYYQREAYLLKMDSIWSKLMGMNLAREDMDTLMNRDLFKYSPYISLTENQEDICYSVIDDIVNKLSKGETGMSLVQGGAGTGKTVVAVKIISILMGAMRVERDIFVDYEVDREAMIMHNLRKLLKKEKLKVGFVVPMKSMRGAMTKVFSSNKKLLGGDLVIGPSDVLKDKYDILFVDESHRLARRKNISYYGPFDATSRTLGMNPESTTQLDWIKKCSRYQVLFYDPLQSIKGSDIQRDNFNEYIKDSRKYMLTTQMRCEGGNSYTDYLTAVFECTCESPKRIDNYDFRIFDDVDDMVQSIKHLDSKIQLCRNVAGYSWEWVSQGISLKEIKERNLEDIHIGNYKYIWNRSTEGWILKDDAINEIGSIHTVQGFDLNYVGVIFGEEIDYNPESNSMMIDRSKFFDKNVKNSTDDEQLKTFVINTYKVLMTRGIKGCYIYCCNENLREYLRKFIDIPS